MKTRTQWWCVIECDDEIARYYRYWVDKQRNPLGLPGHGLCVPAWGAHISVVRGFEPAAEQLPLWRAHEGQTVEFEYADDPIQTGQDPTKPRPDHFWFIHVRCPLARQIRTDFGLYPEYTLHMTIGRTY